MTTYPARNLSAPNDQFATSNKTVAPLDLRPYPALHFCGSEESVTMIRTIACWILVGTVAVSAHHSFAAQYDADKPVTLTGTVARIEWTNPHFHFYVDV